MSWWGGKKADHLSVPASTSSSQGLSVRLMNCTTPLHFPVNNDVDPVCFDTPHFTGRAVVRVKDADTPASTTYFEGKTRLFSILVEGMFKQEWNGDDVLFGAVFDRKIILPTGTWLILKFAKAIDPSLQCDAYSDQPNFLTPIICGMNQMGWRPADDGLGEWRWHKGQRMEDHLDKSGRITLDEEVENGHPDSTSSSERDSSYTIPSDRRSYFKSKENRKNFRFHTDKIYTFEMYSNNIDFNTFDLRMGVSLNFMKYTNGQPITFQAQNSDGSVVFFKIEFSSPLVRHSSSTANLHESVHGRDEDPNHPSHPL
mmetsp:Transcript_5958/g.15124  ORF Transcript_5958/g.15124 Transcript_5958/m.15124 type:complete len:313 (+) Transcript_5958:297-1235(+)